RRRALAIPSLGSHRPLLSCCLLAPDHEATVAALGQARPATPPVHRARGVARPLAVGAMVQVDDAALGVLAADDDRDADARLETGHTHQLFPFRAMRPGRVPVELEDGGMRGFV